MNDNANLTFEEIEHITKNGKTTAQLAKIMQVKQVTVIRWIRESKLNAHKLGKNCYIMEDDLSAFIKSRNKGA